MTIVLIVLVVLFILLFTKMTLTVNVDKAMEGEFSKKINLNFFWVNINLLKPKADKPLKAESIKKAGNEKQKKESLTEKLKKLAENIQRGRYTYLLSKRYVRKKIKVETLNFSMTFGLDDAAHTGIATGAAWGSVYNIFGFLDKLFIVKSHNFSITPVFDGEAFKMSLESKIRFSISNLIAIGFAVFINYIKSGRK